MRVHARAYACVCVCILTGYTVDASNASQCVDRDECMRSNGFCQQQCLNRGEFYMPLPSLLYDCAFDLYLYYYENSNPCLAS